MRNRHFIERRTVAELTRAAYYELLPKSVKELNPLEAQALYTKAMQSAGKHLSRAQRRAMGERGPGEYSTVARWSAAAALYMEEAE